MDGLALLCNLHADGPTALRRLRAAGLARLDLVQRTDPDTLSTLLRTSPFLARRLTVEAGRLAERLGEQVLEPEPRSLLDAPVPAFEGPVSPPADLVEALDRNDLQPDVPEDSTAAALLHVSELVPDVGVVESPSTGLAPEDPGLVFFRNRRPEAFEATGGGEPLSREEEELLAAPFAPAAPEALEPEPEPEHVAELEPAPLVLAEPAEPEEAPEPVDVGPSPLRAGDLPGLDRRTLEKLVHEGIRTHRALIDLACLALARRAGIPYTRLLSLRFASRAYLRQRLGPAVPDPEAPAVPVALVEPGTLALEVDADEPVVELVPAPRRETAIAPRYRPGLVLAGTRLQTDEPDEEPADPVPPAAEPEPAASSLIAAPREEPGVAGPFV